MEHLDLGALKDIVENSGVLHRKNSVSWIFGCPHCGKDKLYIRKRDGRWVCWKCKTTHNYQGARPEFPLRDLLGVSILDIQERLYGAHEFAGTYLHTTLENEDEEEEVYYPEIAWPLDFYPLDDHRSKAGRVYLEGRGVSLDVAIVAGLRYCPPKRVVAFPIQQWGRLVGWQQRPIYPTEWVDPETAENRSVPKYLTYPRGLDHLFMFGDRLAGAEECTITEGPIDALKAHLLPNVVCSMGKGVGIEQIDLIKRSDVKKVYLALDPDASADTRANIERLAHLELHLIRPEGKKDLGDMTPEAVKELYLEAPRVSPASMIVHLDVPVL